MTLAGLDQIPPTRALALLHIHLHHIPVWPCFLSPPQESGSGDCLLLFPIPLFFLVTLPGLYGSSSRNVSLSHSTSMSLCHERPLSSGPFLLTWVTPCIPVGTVHVCADCRSLPLSFSLSPCCHATAGNSQLAQETHSLNSNTPPASPSKKTCPSSTATLAVSALPSITLHLWLIFSISVHAVYSQSLFPFLLSLSFWNGRWGDNQFFHKVHKCTHTQAESRAEWRKKIISFRIFGKK